MTSAQSLSRQFDSERIVIATHRRCRPARRGFALLLVVGAVGAALVIGLAFLAAQATSLGITGNIQDHERARMIAESGLDTALNYLATNDDWRTTKSEGVWVENQPFAGGSFTIEAYDGIDANGDGNYNGDGDFTTSYLDPITLIVTSHLGNVSHICSAVVIAQYNTDPYNLALRNTLTLTHSSIVDSYTSARGPYSPQNSASNANIAVDTIDTSGVNFQHIQSQIRGSVAVGAGGDPDSVINNTARVTGETSTLDEPLTFPPPPDWPDDTGSNLGNISYSGTTILSSDVQMDDLSVTGTLRIADNITIRVNGNFTIGNSTHLEILEGASLNLYVGGNMEFGQLSRTNANTAEPARMTIYAMGSGTTITIRNQAHIHAVFDAPDTDVVAENSAQIFGAIMGSSLTLSNSSQFHIDRSIGIPRLKGPDPAYVYRALWVPQS